MNLAVFLRCSRIFLLLLALCAPLRAQPPQPMIEPHAQAMPLLPFLDYLVDESLAMDIEEVARLNQDWQPMALDKLPNTEGTVWLRFTIAPLAPDARPRAFLLDMGQSVPGQPILYDTVHNELSGAREWRENLPTQRNILLLPEAGAEASPCYIRLEGLPGPWFAPMIRTPQNAASNLSSLARTSGILALAVIMALCILRALGEKGQWRYWTALFVGVALCQAILGMPRETQHFSIADLAATLCPGLALMFLPHVGRHLMQAKSWSRSIDIQLFLLSLPGGILAIMPLIPGWNWLDRWLDLWPAGTILFVPTALGAWIIGMPGSRRFLLACLLPPIFVAVSLLGMEFGLPANLLAAAPIWAIAISALLLAAMRAPNTDQEENKNVKKEKLAKAAAKKKKSQELEMPSLALETEEPIINLDMPLDDPNLRLLPPDKEELPEPPVEEIEGPEAEAPRTPTSAAMEAQEAREMALWKPVDDILREAVALEQCALPPSAKQAMAGIKDAARKLANVLGGEDLEEKKEEGEKRAEVFNLQRVLRNAHDHVAAIAECSGIALSWYMPPHLSQTYAGDGKALETTLRMLLESSVRCSRHGAIKITVRGVPGSAEPGHLLFSVSDDGHGYPPHDRSSLALARAWELTGRHDGYLSMEASHEGVMIAFTAHYKPLDAEMEEEGGENSLILACDEPGMRRHLARILEALPCKVVEVATPAEVLAYQKQSPAPLLVAAGRLARPASSDMVREFCKAARQGGLSPCYALAITDMEDSQWDLLKTSGFTHAMREPVDPEVLRETVAELLQKEKSEKPEFPNEGAALERRGETGKAQAITRSNKDFAMRSIFEGPDWLGEQDEEVEEPPVKKEEPNPELAGPQMPEDGQIAEQGRMPEEEREISQPVAETAPDVVEEPMPAEPEVKVARPEKANAPEHVSEWVGEPTPIEKPVTDFIVGVEEKKPAMSAVKNFMEGSASLVSSTLSGLLSSKKEKSGKEEMRNSQEPEAAQPEAEQPMDSHPEMEKRQEPLEPKPRQPGRPVAAPATKDKAARPGTDPELLAQMDRLDEELLRAKGFHKAKNCAGLATAIAQLAQDAEACHLRELNRLALLVGRAAKAGDIDAAGNILQVLSDAILRTRTLITKY